MKPIPIFKQLLDNDELPEMFSDWWEFDDTDALFWQEYKAQYRKSAHHRFPGQKHTYLDTYYLPREIKKIQTNIGCRRSKPTRKQIDLQKIFYQQYDPKLIEAMLALHGEMSKVDFYRNEIVELQEKIQIFCRCFRDGIKGEELVDASSEAYHKWWSAKYEED